ncbi:unnamed protein product, partial [Mesorhabditis belari]|uniref:Guanylate cyclase n=1 Tax=Mesorhabditis belari TaxID=2138241 RepID=A0AAF3EJP4_9BILA
MLLWIFCFFQSIWRIGAQSSPTPSPSIPTTPPFTTPLPFNANLPSDYPYPPGNKLLKIGVITTEVSSRDIGLSDTGGAIPMAMDYIVQNQILNDYTYEFFTNYTDCDEATAAGVAVQMITDYGVDVIIGPPCTTSIIPVAMLAAYYNTIQIVWGYSTAAALTDNTRFPTLTSITPNTLQMGYGLLALMNLYGWSQFGIVYNDDVVGFCEGLVTDVETAAQSLPQNFTINYRYRLPSGSYADETTAMKRMKSRARIIVMCLDGSTRRQMLLVVKDLNMTSPDYVYILLSMRGTGFGLQAISNYSNEVLDNGFTPQWVDLTNKPPDGRDADAKAASARFLIIDTANLAAQGTNTATLKQEVFQRVTEWPFYCQTSYCQLLYNVSGVGNFISYQYDAMLFYAYAMNATLNQDPVNGLNDMDLYLSVKNQVHFTGWSGNVQMTPNGSRLPTFFVYGLDVNSKPQIFVNLTYAYSGELMTATPTYTDPSTSIWANRGGFQPADEPLCGFTGTDCPLTTWEQSGAYIIAGCAVAAFLVVVLLFFGFYAIRERRRETERQNAEWRINQSQLEKPRGKHDERSMRSLRSSKSSVSGTGSKFSFGSKHNDSDRMSYFLFMGDPVMAMKHKVVSRLTIEDHHELRLIRRMEHDNVHRFIGLCEEASPVLTIWRLASRGSLEQVLTGSSMNIDGFFMYSLIRDLVEGMCYINKSFLKGHRRLSSQVCYIDDRWQLKVGGYGLTFIRGLEQTTKKEQLWFAPEKLREPMTPPIEEHDIYSFAIISSEIITRKTAFDMENRREKVEEVTYMIKKGGSVPLRPDLVVADEADVNPALLHLVRDCWHEEPQNRPRFETIKSLITAMGSDRKQNLMDHVFNILENYAETLEKEVQDRTGELVEEKKKSDILLYRMLPRQVADRLKLGQTVEPEAYDSVTIFFSDVVKFTNLAAKCTPLQIVNLLNDLYSTFDQIIEEHGVYKVETIGDGYLCVSGLPHRNGIQHIRDIAEMSLGILKAIQYFRVPHIPTERINLRIGLHSGSCVAGVVGLTMPRYCLFGDSVNTASRMESNGKPGQIHMSDAANSMIQRYGGYVTEPRGEVIIKGKGVMSTYWLLGRVDEPILPSMSQNRSEEPLVQPRGVEESRFDPMIEDLGGEQVEDLGIYRSHLKKLPINQPDEIQPA